MRRVLCEPAHFLITPNASFVDFTTRPLYEEELLLKQLSKGSPLSCTIMYIQDERLIYSQNGWISMHIYMEVAHTFHWSTVGK